MSQKKVIIDVKGILHKYNQEKGGRLDQTTVANNHELSMPTLANWGKEAPKAVKFVYEFMKETGCQFEELVKEI